MFEALEKGDFNKVTLLIGANSEEYIGLADGNVVTLHLLSFEILYSRYEGTYTTCY